MASVEVESAPVGSEARNAGSAASSTCARATRAFTAGSRASTRRRSASPETVSVHCRRTGGAAARTGTVSRARTRSCDGAPARTVSTALPASTSAPPSSAVPSSDAPTTSCQRPGALPRSRPTCTGSESTAIATGRLSSRKGPASRRSAAWSR